VHVNFGYKYMKGAGKMSQSSFKPGVKDEKRQLYGNFLSKKSEKFAWRVKMAALLILECQMHPIPKTKKDKNRIIFTDSFMETWDKQISLVAFCHAYALLAERKEYTNFDRLKKIFQEEIEEIFTHAYVTDTNNIASQTYNTVFKDKEVQVQQLNYKFYNKLYLGTLGEWPEYVSFQKPIKYIRGVFWGRLEEATGPGKLITIKKRLATGSAKAKRSKRERERGSERKRAKRSKNQVGASAAGSGAASAAASQASGAASAAGSQASGAASAAGASASAAASAGASASAAGSGAASAEASASGADDSETETESEWEELSDEEARRASVSGASGSRASGSQASQASRASVSGASQANQASQARQRRQRRRERAERIRRGKADAKDKRQQETTRKALEAGNGDDTTVSDSELNGSDGSDLISRIQVVLRF